MGTQERSVYGKSYIPCPGRGVDHSSCVCYLTTPYWQNLICILMQFSITDLTYQKLLHFCVYVQMQLSQKIPKQLFFCVQFAMDTCVFIDCLNIRNASSGFWLTIFISCSKPCSFIFIEFVSSFQLHFAVWAILNGQIIGLKT